MGIYVLVSCVKALKDLQSLSIVVSSASGGLDLVMTCIAISCLSVLTALTSLGLIQTPNRLKWPSVTHVTLALVLFIGHMTTGILLLMNANQVSKHLLFIKYKRECTENITENKVLNNRIK